MDRRSQSHSSGLALLGVLKGGGGRRGGEGGGAQPTWRGGGHTGVLYQRNGLCSTKGVGKSFV